MSSEPARELCSREQSSLICHGCRKVLEKCFTEALQNESAAHPWHRVVRGLQTASGTKQFVHHDNNGAKNMVGAVLPQAQLEGRLSVPREGWCAPKISPSRRRMSREPCSRERSSQLFFRAWYPTPLGGLAGRFFHALALKNRPVAPCPTIVRLLCKAEAAPPPSLPCTESAIPALVLSGIA